MRSRDGGGPPLSGPLAEFLGGREVDLFAADPRGFGVDGRAALERFLDAATKLLRPFGAFPGPLTWPWLIEGSSALSRPVRRAWICLEILSDRGCMLGFKQRRAALRRTLDQSLTMPQWTDAMRRWHRLEVPTSGTRHLLPPDGLAETDIGWLGGVRSRAARRTVVARLERLGLIRRRNVRGHGSRFFPSDPTRRRGGILLTELARRRELHEVGRLILRVSGRRRDSGNEWRSVEQSLSGGSFVVGPTLSPAVRRFLEEELAGLRRNLTLALQKVSKHPEYREWIRNADEARWKAEAAHSPRRGTGPVLIMELV